MKYLIIFLTTYLFISCSFSHKEIKNHSQEILTLILNNEHIKKMLDLNNKDEIFSEIRFIDLSYTFRRSYTMIKIDKGAVSKYYPLYIFNKNKLDLNCGYFRDLILYKVKKNNQTYTFTFVICRHLCNSDCVIKEPHIVKITIDISANKSVLQNLEIHDGSNIEDSEDRKFWLESYK